MNQKILNFNNLFINKNIILFKSNNLGLLFSKKSDLLGILNLTSHRNYSTDNITDDNDNHKFSLDFDSETIKFENPYQNLNQNNNALNLTEIILCRILNRKRDLDKYFSTRLFKLEKNGIFKTKTMEIFHEHIIHKSNAVGINLSSQSNNNVGIDFHLGSTSIYFKRPTLYEYVTRKEQQAVSSHYSIISLAPMLLELNKSSRVLECGTGSGSMSLFLSQYLGDNGVLHTFDVSKDKVLKAKKQFWDWKTSYDLYSFEKWPSNIKFGVSNLCVQKFNENFANYYDAIYLDMPDLDKAVYNINKLVKLFGVVVCNAMHLTQIIKMLNVIKEHDLGFETELVIEPNNRFWEIRQIKKKRSIDGLSVDESPILELNDDETLNWTCRLEDRFVEKTKRGGMWFNYWPGYLCKLRKIR